MDNLTKEQRHVNMINIRSKDTKIEILLRKALWAKGIHYRKNVSDLPGKPDIVITRYRIAIFCDGDFFHGRNWESDLQNRLTKSNNSQYWTEKIHKNMEHDHDADAELNGMGWVVLRFWGTDIIKNTEACVSTIEESIFEQKMQL